MDYCLLSGTKERDLGLNRFRRIRLYQVFSLAFFVVVLLFSLVFSIVLRLIHIAIVLLILDFVVALIVAVFGSLSIREEEEETS